MQQSGSELLIYGLIIGVILLFNYVMQQLARRAREQEEAAARDAPILPAETSGAERLRPWCLRRMPCLRPWGARGSMPRLRHRQDVWPRRSSCFAPGTTCVRPLSS
jgi:hypothetical protein